MSEAQDEGEWSRRGIAVTLLCFVLNMVDGVNVFALTYVAPVLQRQFGVGPERFAIAFSAGLVGMAVGGLGLAPLADRRGRRPLILFALALMSVAMSASGLVQGLWALAGARFVVGIGIGTVLASITALSAGFAPERWRHVAAGVPQAGYPVGATIAGFVIAWALPRYGWADVFIGAGLVTFLLIPLCWFALPEAPETRQPGRHTVAEIFAGERRRNTLLLWVCTACGFMALYFVGSWITRLAIQAGLPPTEAIVASAIYNLGACIGTVGLSLAATRIDIRRLIGAAMVLACGLFLAFGGLHLGLDALLVVSFLIGIALQGGVNGNYALVAAVYPGPMRATGLGWAMGVGRAGALAGPLVGGLAMGAGWPLVGVFGIFCVPLLLTAAAARAVRLAPLSRAGPRPRARPA